VRNLLFSDTLRAAAAHLFLDCHPEEAEPSAKSGRLPTKDLCNLRARSSLSTNSIGPSARKERGPQDDKALALSVDFLAARSYRITYA
jgi:hypothetical protein